MQLVILEDLLSPLLIKVLIALAFIVAFIVIELRRKGMRMALDGLESYVRNLLKRGHDGGSYTIKTSDRKVCLILRKYINGPGDYGIQLEIPKKSWPAPDHFSEGKVSDHLKEALILEDEAKEPLEFQIVVFGKDVERATTLVTLILTEVFFVQERDTLFIKPNKICLKNELIDMK